MKRMKVRGGIGRFCKLFGISRQAWYEHEWRQKAVLVDEGKVVEIVLATRKANRGLDKISAKVLYKIMKLELIRNHVNMGRDKTFEVMRKYGLIAKRRRTRARTTFSNVNLPLYPNLAENMNVTRPDQLWVADITYIRIGDSFNYLSLITDAYSHRIMGYYLSETLETSGCLVALEMALANRTNTDKELAHHSDRGFQYRSQDYIALLRKNGIESSMTQNGDPRENAIAERVNGLLKVEMGLADIIYASREDAIEAVRAIIRTYNEVRPHSSVDDLTPMQAHEKTGKLKIKWKRKEVLQNATTV